MAGAKDGRSLAEALAPGERTREVLAQHRALALMGARLKQSPDAGPFHALRSRLSTACETGVPGAAVPAADVSADLRCRHPACAKLFASYDAATAKGGQP